MATTDWVQIIAASVFPLTIVAIIVTRVTSGKGIGVRVVQFSAAAMFFPTLVVLAAGKFINGETLAALIGAFIGYLFANISNFDKSD